MRLSIMPPEPTDVDTWRFSIWLSGNGIYVIAGILCIGMVLLRSYWENLEITGKDVAEAIICGVIVSVSKPVLGAILPWVLGWFDVTDVDPDTFALFFGAVFGFLGAKFLRPILEGVINRGKK